MGPRLWRARELKPASTPTLKRQLRLAWSAQSDDLKQQRSGCECAL